MPKRLKETMIRSDFHMHTAFSTDSEEAVESMLNRAVERGLYSVCITDHMDADYPPDDEMGESAFRLDTENYFPFLLKKKKEQTGKNTTEILKSAIYFTGVDETFVDNLISTIGAHASNNDIEGIKEEVQKYVAYRTRQK